MYINGKRVHASEYLLHTMARLERTELASSCRLRKILLTSSAFGSLHIVRVYLRQTRLLFTSSLSTYLEAQRDDGSMGSYK